MGRESFEVDNNGLFILKYKGGALSMLTCLDFLFIQHFSFFD